MRTAAPTVGSGRNVTGSISDDTSESDFRTDPHADAKSDVAMGQAFVGNAVLGDLLAGRQAAVVLGGQVD